MVKGQRSWRERARARRFKISVGSNSSRRVHGKTRKHGREGRRERTGGTVVDVPRSATRRSSHVRSTAGVCRASPSPAGRPGGEGGQVPGPRVGEIEHTRVRFVACREEKRRGAGSYSCAFGRASRVPTRGPVVDADLDRLQRLRSSSPASAARSNSPRGAPARRLRGVRIVRHRSARPPDVRDGLYATTACSRDDRGRGRCHLPCPNLPQLVGRGVAVGDVLQRLLRVRCRASPGAWWPPWRFPFRPFPPSRAPKTLVPLDDSPRVAMNASPDSLAPPPVACSRAARRPRASAFGKLKYKPDAKAVQKAWHETPTAIDRWCKSVGLVCIEMVFLLCFFSLKAKGSSEKT